MLLFNMRRGDQSGREHMMHLEAGFVFGETGKSERKYCKCDTRGRSHDYCQGENHASDTWAKKGELHNAAYMLVLGDRLFQQWRGIMSSKRISLTGHAFKPPHSCLGEMITRFNSSSCPTDISIRG